MSAIWGRWTPRRIDIPSARGDVALIVPVSPTLPVVARHGGLPPAGRDADAAGRVACAAAAHPSWASPYAVRFQLRTRPSNAPLGTGRAHRAGEVGPRARGRAPDAGPASEGAIAGDSAARPAPAGDARARVDPTLRAGADPLLSALAHDLRSPLQSAQGWLGVLEQSLALDRSITDRAIEGIRRGLRQQAQLLTLLDAAGALLGRDPSVPVGSPTALSGLVRHACERAASRAAAAGVVVHGQPPAIDCRLDAAEDALLAIVDLVVDAVLADAVRPDALWLVAVHGTDARPRAGPDAGAGPGGVARPVLAVATGRTPPADPGSTRAPATGFRRSLAWLLAERLADLVGVRVQAVREGADAALGARLILACHPTDAAGTGNGPDMGGSLRLAPDSG